MLNVAQRASFSVILLSTKKINVNSLATTIKSKLDHHFLDLIRCAEPNWN